MPTPPGGASRAAAEAGARAARAETNGRGSHAPRRDAVSLVAAARAKEKRKETEPRGARRAAARFLPWRMPRPAQWASGVDPNRTIRFQWRKCTMLNALYSIPLAVSLLVGGASAALGADQGTGGGCQMPTIAHVGS